MAPKSNITAIDSSTIRYTVNEISEDSPKPHRKPPLLCIGAVSMGVVCIALVLLTCLVVTSPLETAQGEVHAGSDAETVVADADQELSSMEATTNQIPSTEQEDNKSSPHGNISSHVDISTPPGDTTIVRPSKGEHSKPFPQNSSSAIVDLGCLRLHGSRSNSGSYSFKGIPYAKPPEGALRWKPSQPVKYAHTKSCRNKTSMEAKQFQDRCARILNSSDVLGSEDCLFLNVWTPSLKSSAKLPVVVYIGDFYSESGDHLDSSPNEDILSDSNVVFVRINFRIGIFGIFNLGALLNDSLVNVTEDFGKLDTICALKWIQSNIVYFGGDPNIVTLLGYKSGGIAVSGLLVTPMAKGLFQQAWIASGSSFNIHPVSSNNEFLRNTGCNNTECLYRLTTREVIQAVPISNQSERFNNAITCLQCGLRFLNGHCLQTDGEASLFKTAEEIDIPVLIGSVSGEIDTGFLPPDLPSWNWFDYEVNVRNIFGVLGDNFTSDLLKEYKPSTESTPELQYKSMLSDLFVICPMRQQAGLIANLSREAVYRYVVTFNVTTANVTEDNKSKPIQNLELLAFLGDSSKLLNTSSFDNFREVVLNFIEMGMVPVSSWLPFPNSTAMLNGNTTILYDFHKAQCRFWDETKYLQQDSKA